MDLEDDVCRTVINNNVEKLYNDIALAVMNHPMVQTLIKDKVKENLDIAFSSVSFEDALTNAIQAWMDRNFDLEDHLTQVFKDNLVDDVCYQINERISASVDISIH